MRNEETINPDCEPYAMRRLRFAQQIYTAESLPGFLARCAADHPVPRLGALYKEIGFDNRLPGKLQIADKMTLAKLAYVTRSDAEELSRCAGRLARNKVLAFGNLELLTESIECQVRRIAPTTLREHGFHRHDWLNKHLPYCPLSGELLISRCPRCGGGLGWSYTAGIANCEHCERPVPPSREPGLAKEHTEAYRLFGRLVSLDADIRSESWKELPGDLRSHSPGAVVGVAIRVHRHLRDRCGTKLRSSLHSLKPYEIADTITGAVTLVQDWPYSVQEAVHSKIQEIGDDHKTFTSLWRRLKAISHPRGDTSLEQADLLLSCLPDVARPVWRSFAPSYRVYLQQEARMKTGLKARQLTSAVSAQHLTTTQLPSAGKRNIFYKADEIDALRLLCEQTLPLTKVASTWRLPNYAVEQLAAGKVLTHAGESILAATHSQPRIRKCSGELLARFIMENRSQDRIPRDARPLDKALRMHGGGEKPWIAAFEAILDNDLNWWVVGVTPNAATIQVQPCDVWKLKFEKAELTRTIPLDRQKISKRDAAELLNVTPIQFQRVEKAEDLLFDRVSKADVISKKKIIELAQTYITPAEVNERMKGMAQTDEWQQKMSGLVQYAAGWSRREVSLRLFLGRP